MPTRKDNIGGGHYLIGCFRTVLSTHHANRQRMVVGKDALACDGGGYRNLNLLRENAQRIPRLRNCDSAARHDHRTFSATQDPRYGFHVRRIRMGTPRGKAAGSCIGQYPN